jgi:hypothetical protein
MILGLSESVLRQILHVIIICGTQKDIRREIIAHYYQLMVIAIEPCSYSGPFATLLPYLAPGNETRARELITASVKAYWCR